MLWIYFQLIRIRIQAFGWTRIWNGEILWQKVKYALKVFFILLLDLCEDVQATEEPATYREAIHLFNLHDIFFFFFSFVGVTLA